MHGGFIAIPRPKHPHTRVDGLVIAVLVDDDDWHARHLTSDKHGGRGTGVRGQAPGP